MKRKVFVDIIGTNELTVSEIKRQICQLLGMPDEDCTTTVFNGSSSEKIGGTRHKAVLDVRVMSEEDAVEVGRLLIPLNAVIRFGLMLAYQTEDGTFVADFAIVGKKGHCSACHRKLPEGATSCPHCHQQVPAKA